MKCEDADLLAYLKGELDETSATGVQAHLSGCTTCHAESERSRMILRALQTEEWVEPGSEFTDRVMAAVEPAPIPEAVADEHRPVRTLREFFDVLFGRSQRTVPAWAFSVGVHLLLFGVLTLFIYAQLRDDDVIILTPQDFAVAPTHYVPKEIPSIGVGPRETTPAPRDVEAPEFEPRREREGELEDPKYVPGPVRRHEEDDRKHRVLEHVRVFDVAAWWSPEARAERDGQFDPEGRYREAVEKALAHMATQQSDSGLWETEGAAKDYEIGVTGLSLLGFLAHGSTHKSGPYRETVERGINALRTRQRDGLIGEARGNYMYNHAIATIALLEAYLRSGKERDLWESCHSAVETLVLAQNLHGGWRYRKGDKTADISVSIWAIQALRVAIFADFDLAIGAIVRAKNFISKLLMANGRYSYGIGWPQEPERRDDADWWTTRLAMGMFGTVLSTHGVDRVQLREQATLLLGETVVHPPEESSRNDLCRFYYGALATFQLKGGEYRSWWGKVAPAVADLQGEDGSLPLKSDRWWRHAGPHYPTAMAALILQTYHRFPPLH